MLGVCISGARTRTGLRIIVHKRLAQRMLLSTGQHLTATPCASALVIVVGSSISWLKCSCKSCVLIGSYFAYNLGSIISQLREWEALHDLSRVPLLKEILMSPKQEQNASDDEVQVRDVR